MPCRWTHACYRMAWTLDRKTCSHQAQTWHAWQPNIWSSTGVITKQFILYLSHNSLTCHIASTWITSFLKSLDRGIPGLKFRWYLCIENISTNSKGFQLWCESLLNGRRTTLRWKRRYYWQDEVNIKSYLSRYYLAVHEFLASNSSQCTDDVNSY